MSILMLLKLLFGQISLLGEKFDRKLFVFFCYLTLLAYISKNPLLLKVLRQLLNLAASFVLDGVVALSIPTSFHDFAQQLQVARVDFFKPFILFCKNLRKITAYLVSVSNGRETL